MSGRAIADGYGSNGDLNFDFTSSGVLTEAVNGTGTNGWFAVNRGRLLLPVGRDNASYVKSASGATYNWGDKEYDATIDMLNSAQFVFTGLGANNGQLDGQLLATDRTDVAASAPDNRRFVSVHQFRLWSNTATSHTLAIRYDHTAIEALGLIEETVRLYRYDGSKWVNVTATLDTVNKIVTSSSITASLSADYRQFAVTAEPPPSGTTIILR